MLKLQCMYMCTLLVWALSQANEIPLRFYNHTDHNVFVIMDKPHVGQAGHAWRMLWSGHRQAKA